MLGEKLCGRTLAHFWIVSAGNKMAVKSDVLHENEIQNGRTYIVS